MEIEALHNSKHENVIIIYGYSKFRNNIALLMEYMRGGSLYTLIIKSTNDKDFDVANIPFSLRIKFCADICSGVAYLHGGFGHQRIVHGDIKPGNILLTINLDCKIADFGGAELTVHSNNSSKFRIRKKGKTQSTLGYVAPEVRDFKVRSENYSATKPMDVYSVGATIFFVLLRKDPSIIDQTKFEEQLKTCSYPTNISLVEISHFEKLKSAMQKCCENKPEERCEIKNVRDLLKEHMSTSAGCDDESLKRHVAAITSIYKVNTRSSNFEEPKCLFNVTFQDFDVDLEG